MRGRRLFKVSDKPGQNVTHGRPMAKHPPVTASRRLWHSFTRANMGRTGHRDLPDGGPITRCVPRYKRNAGQS